jgi:hypothetical protein
MLEWFSNQKELVNTLFYAKLRNISYWLWVVVINTAVNNTNVDSVDKGVRFVVLLSGKQMLRKRRFFFSTIQSIYLMIVKIFTEATSAFQM